jgi:predicted nucleotidyltransferase
MRGLGAANLTEDERRVLVRWLELVVEELDVESVWLYGSRARGHRSQESDVDLLVIARGEKPRKDRSRAYRLIEQAAQETGASFLPFSIHLWDPNHLENRRQIRSFFLQEVERDKIVLFESHEPAL